MCGIVGVIGEENATPILLKGLSKLEYRGYDSAGIAIRVGNNDIRTVKAKGRLKELSNKIEASYVSGFSGIGHTRWATHGEPSETNAHPHASKDNYVVLVHNGIIENYRELKEYLMREGYTFSSSTDTEAAVMLIDYCVRKYKDPIKSLCKAVSGLKGSFAMAIMLREYKDKIYLVRKDSPLIVGTNGNNSYIASDVPAILEHTDTVYYMSNMELAEVGNGWVKFYGIDGHESKKEPTKITWSAKDADIGDYEHFMLKEIHEQPVAIKNTISSYIKDGRIDFSSFGMSEELLKDTEEIMIVGCGSAYHVGAINQYIIEELTSVPVRVELASELRYRAPIYRKNQLVIVISQSGETADTLTALKNAKEKGVRTLAIVNVMGSSIAREADYVLYTHAGPEIAVATTKAYTAQLAVCLLIALKIAEVKGKLREKEISSVITEMEHLPEKIEKILEEKEKIKWLASKFVNIKDAFLIGRGVDYGICMEGSLKMKEISYVHSEAYAAGELKHGTISLIENGTLVIGSMTQERVREKTLSNLMEVKTRGAYVAALVYEGDKEAEEMCDFVFRISKTQWMLAPITGAVPLQLLGYYMSVLRGHDVDKPRNLAKSVTVE